jgi:S1-C subfamily serine protease
MKRIPTLLLAVILPAAACSADPAGPDPDVRDAIVKIYTIQNRPDFYNPWSMQGPRSSTGSGCMIKDRKILTNAHVVGDQTFLQVRRHGEARRYQARLISVSHEADLALLTVDDPAFFDGVEPLDFGELPEVQQEVQVYGFPLGGDTLSTTKGVVSRIEHQTYAHSSCYFLAGQIDAAINPGNSGGPVVVGDRIVGVVMQSITRADNIGYMVPVPLIRHFLDDLVDGTYHGYPSLGVVTQDLDNPDLKAMYQLPEKRTGLLIVRVLPGSPAMDQLRVGDVLLSIEGREVADDGTVEFRPRERTSMAYYVQQKQVGAELSLEIWRDGRVLPLALTLHRPLSEDWLVPMETYDTQPTYYIYGGLVFCRLNKNLLQSWGGNWFQSAPRELVAILSSNFQETEGEEVVLLLKVLASDINEGYHGKACIIIEQVNGQPILNLQDLIRLVETGDDPYVVFHTRGGQLMALGRERVRAGQPNILKTYRIAWDRSEDLRGGE